MAMDMVVGDTKAQVWGHLVEAQRRYARTLVRHAKTSRHDPEYAVVTRELDEACQEVRYWESRIRSAALGSGRR
jgi:hypothetical protein